MIIALDTQCICTHWSLGVPYCALTSSVCRSWQLADMILSALSLMAWVKAAQSLFRLIPLPTQFWAPAHRCLHKHTHMRLYALQSEQAENAAKCIKAGRQTDIQARYVVSRMRVQDRDCAKQFLHIYSGESRHTDRATYWRCC